MTWTNWKWMMSIIQQKWSLTFSICCTYVIAKRRSLKAAGRQADWWSDGHKVCLAPLEDTGSYRSIIRHFFADLLTIVRLVSCVLVSPSNTPTPTSLSLFCSPPFLSVCCALKFWRVKDVLFSSTVAQTHTHTHTHRHTHTHTHTYSRHVHAWSTMSVWLSIFAVGPSLNGISWLYHISGGE